MEKSQDKGRITTIIACFIMVMSTLGFASGTKTLFPDEVSRALDIERSLFSITETCRYVTTAIINLFFGTLMRKFGAKKLICAGFISIIASMLMYSAANSLLPIYIAGCLLGLGISWTSTTMVGNIVEGWGLKNKGAMMGAILASNGVGGAIAIQIVGGLIDPATVGSYRRAYRAIAIALVIALALVIILMREKYARCEVGKKQPKKNSAGASWEGLALSQALRKWYFWGMLVCIFFSGMIIQGTHDIVAMHMKDVGVDYSRVKALLSFGFLILSSAKVLAGFVYDKLGLRTTASICMCISVVSSVLLASVKGGDVGFVIAIIYVILSQFAMPLETVMLPLYASDLFGSRDYPHILGIFVSVNMAGFSVGAPVMNLCFDICHSYVPAIIAVGVMMAIMLVLIQFAIPSAHRERDKQAVVTE